MEKLATITISTRTIVEAILFLLLVWFLFFIKELVLIVLTAVVIASAIEPATRFLMRYRLPRVASVLAVYLLVAVVFFGIFFFFLPPLLNEASNFLAAVPRYIDLFAAGPLPGPADAIVATESILAPGEGLSIRDFILDFERALSNISTGLVRTVSAVFGGVLSFILIVVFSFYFAMQETGVDDFLRVVTPLRHQRYVIDLWKRSQHKIGLWMQGQLLLAVIVGVLVYLGLTILGVKYALLLAVLAALFELIPVFGPVLAAIPAVGIALVEGGATLGLLTAGLFVIIQQFENHLIYPLVVTKVVGVPPLLVILGLIVGAKVAGFLGIILSVPVAAVIQELVADLTRARARAAEAGASG